MAIKMIVRYFILGIILSLLPVPTYAQGEEERNRKAGKTDVPEETEGEIERREDAEETARTREERLARTRMAEILSRIDEANLKAMYSDPRDLKEAREHYNRKIRLNDFLKDVDKFQRVAVDVRACMYSPMSESWAARDLEKHSEELEKMTERLIKFIDYGIDPPPIQIAPLPSESLEFRLRRLARMTNRLLPRVIELTPGDLLDLNMQREVRRELALMKALARGLPN